MGWLLGAMRGGRDSLADLFWLVATSNLMLGVIGLVALAAVVVTHVPLIRWIPTIDHWMRLASAVGYVALFLLGLLIGHRLADERAETKRLRDQLQWSQLQLEQQEATAKDAEKLKNEAEAAAREAKDKLDDYRNSLTAAPACRFTDDDLRRLRDLRRRPR